MRHTLAATLFALALFATRSTYAQITEPPMQDMPGMDTHPMQMPMPQSTPEKPAGMDMNMDMNTMKPPTNLIEAELAHITSGTSIEPPSTPVSMLMHSYRGW